MPVRLQVLYLVTTKRGKKERLKYHIVALLVAQLTVFSLLLQIIGNGWICFMKLNIMIFAALNPSLTTADEIHKSCKLVDI